MIGLEITARSESWPLGETFVISRGAKTAADVIVVEARSGSHVGRGEAVPYARYDESIPKTLAAIASITIATETGVPSLAGFRQTLRRTLPPGAARNAIDCALWDLEAKLAGTAACVLAGQPTPAPCLTAYTLSLGTPEVMAAKAISVGHLPLLKLKLGGLGDAERMRAVRAARPDARLVADANEGWTEDLLPQLLAVAEDAKFELIEQPLPAGADAMLAHTPRRVALCADESLHTVKDLPLIAERYEAINVKLDKAGGLTEALLLATEARGLGLKIMVGCMVATSLAMAPALLLTANADWVDLDGPLLLVRDREHGLTISDGIIMPASAALWG